jgi:hypothetical protein
VPDSERRLLESSGIEQRVVWNYPFRYQISPN